VFLLDILQKELLRQANGSEIKQETPGKKRKRSEQTDEDTAYPSDGKEFFVAASDSARKARKSGGRADIETINLIDNLEDD
jgi:hypothetical protein